MCGIAGIHHFAPHNVSLDVLKKMTGVLHHRGPDECGIYIDDWVGLGHTRLSIIDLSSGVQPIHNEDKTKWIVYNGEVFNYVELRSELEKRGHQFYTTSDTEVLLHLYEEKGADCLQDLNGQFAFAIWDSKKKELFLARDRVGIRPLHFTRLKNSLLFASEIKSLFMNTDVERDIDPIAFDQIFTFWTTLKGKTAFRNIQELPPGHYLKSSHGQITITKYWDVPFYSQEAYEKRPFSELVEEARALLLDATRIRLRADVPVGTYLSGGLDSSGISALVVNNFNHDVSTFGIRFQENIFDEGDFQNHVASFLNTNHYEIVASNEEIGLSFPDVVRHCEKPMLRTSPVPLYLLSRFVREKNLKVVLTGEGADEVFGGYNIFRETKVRNFWAKQPNSKMRAALIGKLYPYIFKDSRHKLMLQMFFSKGLDQVDHPFFSHLIRWENTAKTKTFFSGELKEAIGSYSGYEQLRQDLPPDFQQWDSLTKAQYFELTIFMSNYLLSCQGDRVAMANSLEIRLPYLDPRLIDFMGRVPSHWKIQGLNEKYLLKKCFQGILPDKILKRPKHPYRSPIKQSLLNPATTTYINDTLSEQSLKKAGLFNAPKVGKLLQKLKKADQPSEIDSMALVGILSSQLLYHQFIENSPSTTDLLANKWYIIDRR